MKPYFIGFLGALSAVVLSYLAYTAYVDHTITRALLERELQREKAAISAPLAP